VSGLILASAIIPTTQVMVAYQDAELNGQTMLAQTAATVRAEQLIGAVWRDPNAPDGHATLQAATASQLQVGDWQLRASGNRLEQQRSAGGWTPLAQPVQGFSFQYLLDDGTWTAAPAAGQFADVIVIRFTWTDADSGLPYGGLVVTPDCSFAAGGIDLETPSIGTPYRRADYTRTMTLSLGTWP
jgi:hypothetical protein